MARPKLPPDPARDALMRAHASYKKGDFVAAARLAEEVLKKRGNEADALYLLGVARLKLGLGAEAVDLLARAAKLDERNPDLHNAHGAALAEIGRTDEAIFAYRRALVQKPQFAQAQYNLANALGRAGHHAEAVPAYQAALADNPGYAQAHNNLGLALERLGRTDEALAAFTAATGADRALFDAWLNLGRLQRTKGAFAEALAAIATALALRPIDPEALNLRGIVLIDLERLDEAVAVFETLLARDRFNPGAQVNLGNALASLGRHDAAMAAFEAALALDPGCIQAINGIANVHKAEARYADALVWYEKALAQRPGYTDALSNLAETLKTIGRWDEGVARYGEALALDPAHRDARYGRALANLSLGRFGEGWHDYLGRPSIYGRDAGYYRTPLAVDLRGRRLFVTSDQGLGDEIFFLRFLAALKARGAWAAYRTDPRLAAMLARAGVADAICLEEASIAGIHHVVSIGDLPYLLGTTERDAVPVSIAILPLGPHVSAIRARLNAFGLPPYIGVTWRAGTAGKLRALYKEVGAVDIARALARTDARVVVVQRNPAAGEVAAFAAALGRQVLDLSALNDDLEAIHAAIGLLDDYVAVSNTNVHLRWAQGRTSRVVVPNPPEFRWMAQGEASPWFPGTRVYRQRTDGDWSEALEQLALDLSAG